MTVKQTAEKWGTSDRCADPLYRGSDQGGNYTNLQKGVHETTIYLELFLRNLLLGEKHTLKNRSMHIGGTLEGPKCQTVILEEKKLIERISGKRFDYWIVEQGRKTA